MAAAAMQGTASLTGRNPGLSVLLKDTMTRAERDLNPSVIREPALPALPPELDRS